MADSVPKREWLQRVLGIAIPVQGEAADPALAGMYAELLGTITADLRALRSADPRAAAPIAQSVAEARSAAQAGRLEAAVATLSAAAEALAAASRTARAAAAKAAIPEGTVARMRDLLAKSATRWDQARAAARSGARAFQGELQARYPEEAAGFQAILDSYWSDLSEAIAAGSEGTEPDATEVVKFARTLRAEMQADRLFAYLDQNGIAVRPAFVAALDEVEGLLSA